MLKLLYKFEELFGGKIGTWKTDQVDLELEEDMKLIFLWPYPAPKVHKEMFKKEVEHLFLLVFIKVGNDSVWWAPSFARPKHKSNRVRLPSGFINLS